jgi:hypothetical protein
VLDTVDNPSKKVYTAADTNNAVFHLSLFVSCCCIITNNKCCPPLPGRGMPSRPTFPKSELRTFQLNAGPVFIFSINQCLKKCALKRQNDIFLVSSNFTNFLYLISIFWVEQQNF